MHHKTIQFLAGQYVSKIIIEQLPKNLVFHNLHHTVNVVKGVRKISKNLGLSSEQKEILILAAWFHDVGLIEIYKEHEEVSKRIATEFLEAHDYPKIKLKEVLLCIEATKMPQNPQTILQKVICDADLFHLSLPEYCHLQKLLLEEWRVVLNKQCTDLEWVAENLHFMTNHHFWTDYGKNELSKEKEINVQRCKLMLKEK